MTTTVRTNLPTCILAALSVMTLAAQTQDFAPGTVGIPYSVDLGSELATVSQEIAQIGEGISFTYSFAVTNPPPGLTMSPAGVFSGTPTTPGTFNSTLTIQETLLYQGQTIFDETLPFPISIVISGSSSGGAATVDPPGLDFPFAAGMTAAVSQSLEVSNPSSQLKTFTVSATTQTPGSWLSVSPASGSLGAFGSSSIQVTVNPAGLAAGAYTGLISVNVAPTGESFSIPVDAVLNSSAQNLDISEDGLRFQAVQGGGAPPADSLEVFNDGTGTLSFAAAASTASGGNWLSVSPTKGTADSTVGTELAVSVNPAGLLPWRLLRRDSNHLGERREFPPDRYRCPQCNDGCEESGPPIVHHRAGLCRGRERRKSSLEEPDPH